VRDDFPQSVRTLLARRVGLLCSNPECRAHTDGPQTDPLKAISVGVAAHITAASGGGPRFDPELSDKQRAGVANGMWLCQNCAKLVDSDVVRFSAAVLRGWKLNAEWEAKRRLGKTNATQSRQNTRAETEIKRAHRLRDDMKKAMLKSSAERLKRPTNQSRFWKFAEGEFVVHRLGDTLYPAIDKAPGISNWFKLETFDFYNNGIEGILNLEYALGSAQTGQWASLKDGEHEHNFPPGFSVKKVFKTGKIPWRNIRHCDPRGDNFYNCPHLYCLYADDGMPYEGLAYYLTTSDNSFEFEVSIANRVDLDVLLGGHMRASRTQ
jgi:hypothetical protein